MIWWVTMKRSHFMYPRGTCFFYFLHRFLFLSLLLVFCKSFFHHHFFFFSLIFYSPLSHWCFVFLFCVSLPLSLAANLTWIKKKRTQITFLHRFCIFCNKKIRQRKQNKRSIITMSSPIDLLFNQKSACNCIQVNPAIA